MKKLLLYVTAAMAAVIVFGSCERGSVQIIPYPQEVKAGFGEFDFDGVSFIIKGVEDPAASDYIRTFQALVQEKTGKVDGRSRVVFVCDASLAPEEYVLQVRRRKVEVRASALNGFVYAIQSLKQMMPLCIWGGEVPQGQSWKVPAVKIHDYPRFGYRGQHLDCSRHFFSTDEVKKILNLMSVHKMNRFHWHLTDDQGWRVEIRKHPRLTSVGGWRNGTMIGKSWSSDDHVRYGGFYSQEELRDVVAYAASLGITVIPEIDMPGHMQGVLAAYPELGCTGGPYDVWKVWGVSEEVLCAGNEKVYALMEDVLTELMDIFPSEYIHIGGDECPKVRWKSCPKCQAKIHELGLCDDDHFKAEDYLQTYYMNRVEKFLNEHGRKIIGWDEILEGDISQSATIMSWRGTEGGIKAAQSGRDAIMTPNSHMYLDYCQSDTPENEPLCIGGCLPLEKVYSYEPLLPTMTEEECSHILGVQANLWTEYIASNEYLEYMLLPRHTALSEVQWCNADNKDWERFCNSLKHMQQIYEALGFNYRK